MDGWHQTRRLLNIWFIYLSSFVVIGDKSSNVTFFSHQFTLGFPPFSFRRRISSFKRVSRFKKLLKYEGNVIRSGEKWKGLWGNTFSCWYFNEVTETYPSDIISHLFTTQHKNAEFIQKKYQFCVSITLSIHWGINKLNFFNTFNSN